MRIVHIITGLNNGGAEGVLYRLVINDKANEHIVVSMMDAGKYGPLLIKNGIQVICLEMDGGKFSLSSIILLYKKLKSIKPDLVQTWMYHADLIGGIVARLAGVKRVIWNIRHSNFDEKNTKKMTILIASLCGKLSPFIPEKIICCAESAVKYHTDKGYTREKIIIIGNGYDLDKFLFNRGLGVTVKDEWELDNTPVIGMIGRYDPQKDHKNLLESLSIVKQKDYKFKLILVGRGLNIKNDALVSYIRKYNLTENTYLLDQRSDIPNILNAIDIHVLSSAYGEGFPNVVAEAMVCGVPCVVTDVGDSKFIVGQFGEVVPPSDSGMLAEAIIRMLQLRENKEEWENLKERASFYAKNNFDLKLMISKYNAVWHIV
ncbi:glycosyltransferase [Acinetobacter haemolyticus]|uniref:glycosyltransferase n=1 Tax=Acinetobacter haemolyticus TaxID=29430 RepID=UPI0013725746|nr:glycosyltransferase [Acinetobacter haemolyticus]